MLTRHYLISVILAKEGAKNDIRRITKANGQTRKGQGAPAIFFRQAVMPINSCVAKPTKDKRHMTMSNITPAELKSMIQERRDHITKLAMALAGKANRRCLVGAPKEELEEARTMLKSIGLTEAQIKVTLPVPVAASSEQSVNLRCPKANCTYFAKTTVGMMRQGRLRCPVDHSILRTKDERGESRGRHAVGYASASGSAAA